MISYLTENRKHPFLGWKNKTMRILGMFGICWDICFVSKGGGVND